MQSMYGRRAAVVTWLFFCVSFAVFCGSRASGQEAIDSASATKAPLTAEQVVKKLEEKNQERALALRQFQGSRVYRMQYRGFPGNRDAEMTVTIEYHSPETKKFSIVSQSGSKFIIDHVFKKLLEGEQEAANDENRQRTALDTTNYDFSLAGYETPPEGPRYILAIVPKTKNKFLYRGKIWVDANDFAVTQIEAQPAKSPSFWIKKSEIQHKYIKVGDFWLPAENHTQSWIRLGGRADLTIEYKDYMVVDAVPMQAGNGGHDNAKVVPSL